MNLLIKFNHPRIVPQFYNGEADSIPDVRIHSADSIRLLQFPNGSRKIQRFIDHRKQRLS